MSVQRQTLGTPAARQKERLDILLLLEKMGFKTLQMKLFAGALIHTALSTSFICFAVSFSIIGIAGSNTQVQQALGRIHASIVISGLVVFALFGLLAFFFSRNVSVSLDLRRSNDRGRLVEQLAEANDQLVQSRSELGQWEKRSELSKSELERSGKLLLMRLRILNVARTTCFRVEQPETTGPMRRRGANPAPYAGR